MYLSKVRIWNFRRYGCQGESLAESTPGVEVVFNDGLNVLIGENDTGKTAIIDAIRYVLHTQSGEYYSLDDKDFYKPKDGDRANELKIECEFAGFSITDAGTFLEWLDYNPKTKEQYLVVRLYAKRLNGRIIPKFSVGENATFQMDWEARDLLKVVYLKPLRDALTDMTHGYKSRLAQILSSLPTIVMSKSEDGKHKLETLYENHKKEIDSYFSSKNKDGVKVLDELNEILTKHFLRADENRSAKILLTGNELPDILRQLDLVLEVNKSGLGSLNLLCIAAELLLYKEQQQRFRLTLIEEMEAHLHPQYQLSLVNFIKEQKEQNVGQFILTTHSTVLGSTIPLESLIVVKQTGVYPMGHEFTKLSSSDYRFLERFLEATRANLFFARGIITVEGDAENLLLPVIAEIIDRPLYRYGVSIINVGSTAFKRYVNIFKRKEGKDFYIPISIVSDLDVRALEYYTDKGIEVPEGISTEDKLKSKRAEKKQRLEEENNDGCIKIFLPDHWTLEYEIAKSRLYKYLMQAIFIAKKVDRKSFEYDESLLQTTQTDVAKQLNSGTEEEESIAKDVVPDKQQAYVIFKELNDKNVSKASTAQYLADLLLKAHEKDRNNGVDETSIQKILRTDKNLKYLVDAIYHVTEPFKS